VSISIGACFKRRCCFYTKQNKAGNEFCINIDASAPEELKSVQAGGKFVEVECLPQWSSTIHVTGGSSPVLNVACGETLNIPSSASLTITGITTTPCSVDEGKDESGNGNSQAIAEAIEGQYYDQFDEVAADQAVADDLVGDEQFDAAVGDVEFAEAFDEQFVDQSVDQFAEQLAVDEFAADQAVADDFVGDEQYVDQSADQAFSEQFDAAVGDQTADQVFVDEVASDQAVDQAVGDDFVGGEQYVDQSADQQDVFPDVTIVTESAVYDEETDFVADGNIDAAFTDLSFSVDQSIDLAVADYNDQTFAAVYDEEADFVADGNIDAAFTDSSFSVDQSVDLAVADYNDQTVADASADQFVDESFSDADQLDDQLVDNY